MKSGGEVHDFVGITRVNYVSQVKPGVELALVQNEDSLDLWILEPTAEAPLTELVRYYTEFAPWCLPLGKNITFLTTK